MTTQHIPAIVITGPVGAGKSTIGGTLTGAIGDHGLRAAFIDMDYLRWLHPNASGDRFSSRLGFRNLAAMWPNLVDAGVRCVVLADVVEAPAQAATYAALMPGSAVTIVRLDVPMARIRDRLRQRERTPEDLAWSLARAPELQGIMEQAGVGDIVIDAGERDPHDLAAEILRVTGLLEHGEWTGQVLITPPASPQALHLPGYPGLAAPRSPG